MNAPAPRVSTADPIGMGALPFPNRPCLGIEWDAENRLLAINQGTLRSEFSYDGESRRVRIVEKASAVVQSDTRFVWCEKDLCEARTGDPLAVTERYYTQGTLTNGSLRFYARDHLESVREVTDGQANVVARMEYDPYGRSSVAAGTAPTFEFNGNYRHSPTNLLLTLYRAYDPDLGRWLSSDPIRFFSGTNHYTFVTGNPVRYTDPLGLLRTQGFPPDRQGDVDEALRRLREKLDDCSDCAGKQKEKLRKLLDDPSTILKYDPNLKRCGQTGPMTVTGLNKTFAVGPKAWNCCRNPLDPIDSLASTIGHELVHFRNAFNSDDEAYDFEAKCFGCF